MIDDQNPYRAPTSALTNTVNLRTAELAGKGRRFGTLLLDYVCYILCAAVLGAFVGLAFGEEGVAAMERIPDILLGVIVMLTYYVFFEGVGVHGPLLLLGRDDSRKAA